MCGAVVFIYTNSDGAAAAVRWIKRILMCRPTWYVPRQYAQAVMTINVEVNGKQSLIMTVG